MSATPTQSVAPATYAKGIPDEKSDPTGNVLQLVAAEAQRQDDLREAERRYNDLREKHAKEINSLDRDYREKLAEKESSRLDSIRQVDREDVNKTAVAAQTAIKTLADSTVALKDTLQLQVTAAATNVENRQIAFSTEVNKRLSNLELQYSEGKGKSDVREPANDELIKLEKELSSQKSQDTGKNSGMEKMAGWIIAGIVVVVTLLISAAAVAVTVISKGQ